MNRIVLFVTVAVAHICAWAQQPIEELWKKAQWNDREALTQLAERHRFGCDGAEKSLITAMGYYEKAGRNSKEFIEEAYSTDPNDELGLYFNLMSRLLKSDKTTTTEHDLLASLDSIGSPLPSWAQYMKDILTTPKEERYDKYSRYILAPEDGDSWLAVSLTVAEGNEKRMEELMKLNSPQYLSILRGMTQKIPLLASLAADVLLGRYKNQQEGHYLQEALDFYHELDQRGLLTEWEMVRILTFIEEEGSEKVIPFTSDDLARFESLIPEEIRELYADPTAPVDEEIEEVEAFEE